MSEPVDADPNDDEQLEDEDELEDEEFEDEDIDDEEVTPERVAMMISGIQKHMPDAVIEVNGKPMTAAEIVAQFQAYLDAVAATAEAKRQLDEAELAAQKSGEALEAAIREHYATGKLPTVKN
jgi:hypothetical protein